MGGHLTSAAGRIGGRAHGLQQHLSGSHAQRETQCAIAIVGEKPVVAGTHSQRGAHLQRFMAGGRDLEVGLLLPFEDDFAVVYTAGENHQPVDLDHLLRA